MRYWETALNDITRRLPDSESVLHVQPEPFDQRQCPPDQYVRTLLEFGRQALRVLRPEGKLWLLLEDGWFGQGLELIDLAAEAHRRDVIHRHHLSCRPLGKDFTLKGLAGEVVFAREFGLTPDLTLRPGGDNGVDFETALGTIDVKTSVNHKELLREAGKPHADILVLAGYLEQADRDLDRARLLGWEWDYVIRERPIEKRKLHNHIVPTRLLRPMSELRSLLGVKHQPGALLGLPWQVLFGLQDQGWRLPFGNLWDLGEQKCIALLTKPPKRGWLPREGEPITFGNTTLLAQWLRAGNGKTVPGRATCLRD